MTGIVFGILPDGQRRNPIPSMPYAEQAVPRATALRVLQKSLVVAQVAFSISLLIAAGLVTQSLRNLEGQHFGFVTDGRLIVNIAPSLSGYTPDKLDGLYQRLEETMPQIPGVLSASLSCTARWAATTRTNACTFREKHRTIAGQRPPGTGLVLTISRRSARVRCEGRVIEERDSPAV